MATNEREAHVLDALKLKDKKLRSENGYLNKSLSCLASDANGAIRAIRTTPEEQQQDDLPEVLLNESFKLSLDKSVNQIRELTEKIEVLSKERDSSNVLYQRERSMNQRLAEECERMRQKDRENSELALQNSQLQLENSLLTAQSSQLSQHNAQLMAQNQRLQNDLLFYKAMFVAVPKDDFFECSEGENDAFFSTFSTPKLPQEENEVEDVTDAFPPENCFFTPAKPLYTPGKAFSASSFFTPSSGLFSSPCVQARKKAVSFTSELQTVVHEYISENEDLLQDQAMPFTEEPVAKDDSAAEILFSQKTDFLFDEMLQEKEKQIERLQKMLEEATEARTKNMYVAMLDLKAEIEEELFKLADKFYDNFDAVDIQRLELVHNHQETFHLMAEKSRGTLPFSAESATNMFTASLKRKIALLEQENSQLEKAFQNALACSEPAREGGISGLTATVEALRIEEQTFKSDFEDLQVKYSSLSRSYLEVQSELLESDKVVQLLEEQISVLHAQVAEMQDLVAGKEFEAAESKSLLLQTTEELLKEQQKSTEISAFLTQEQQKSTEISTFLSQEQQKNAQLSTLLNELTSNESKLRMIELELQELEELRQRTQVQQTQIAALESQLALKCPIANQQLVQKSQLANKEQITHSQPLQKENMHVQEARIASLESELNASTAAMHSLQLQLQDFKDRNLQLNQRLAEIASKLSFCSGIDCSDDEETPEAKLTQPTLHHWKQALEEVLFEHSMRISNRFHLASSQIQKLGERVASELLALKAQLSTQRPGALTATCHSHSDSTALLTLQEEKRKLSQDSQSLHSQTMDLQSRLSYSESKAKDFERESHFLQRKLQVKEVELESLANTLDSLRSQFHESKEAYAQDLDSLKRQGIKYKGAISALKESLTVAGEKLARYKRRWHQDQQRIKDLQFQKAYLNGIALEFRECEKTMARIMIAGVGSDGKKGAGATAALERMKGLFAVGRAVVKMKQRLARGL